MLRSIRYKNGLTGHTGHQMLMYSVQVGSEVIAVYLCEPALSHLSLLSHYTLSPTWLPAMPQVAIYGHCCCRMIHDFLVQPYNK